MKITSFSVKGFKNFIEKVELTDLKSINVIHGDNNIGKSNLVESIYLFFCMISNDFWSKEIYFTNGLQFNFQDFYNITHCTASDIFNLHSPGKIEIQCKTEFEEEELNKAQIDENWRRQLIEIALTLELSNSFVNCSFKQFSGKGLKGPVNFMAKVSQNPPMLNIIRNYSQLIARENNVFKNNITNRFALIDDARRVKGDHVKQIDLLGLVPQALRLQLYDAKESVEPERYNRWNLFVQTIKDFNSQLGDGEIVAIYDRNKGLANLVLQTANIRIPIDLMGSGVQQIIGIVGRLLMTQSTIVAIEEPESNLRYSLQIKLRELLQSIVDDKRGPRQIFITSHSPAFELPKDRFYGMKYNKMGHPSVEKYPANKARDFTAFDLNISTSSKKVPLSYVTSEGLVLVPKDIRNQLGIDSGGSVTFVTSPSGHVEMLNDSQFFELAGETEDSEDNDA